MDQDCVNISSKCSSGSLASNLTAISSILKAFKNGIITVSAVGYGQSAP